MLGQGPSHKSLSTTNVGNALFIIHKPGNTGSSWPAFFLSLNFVNCESPPHKLLCTASIGDGSFHPSQASNTVCSWQQYLFCDHFIYVSCTQTFVGCKLPTHTHRLSAANIVHGAFILHKAWDTGCSLKRSFFVSILCLAVFVLGHVPSHKSLCTANEADAPFIFHKPLEHGSSWLAFFLPLNFVPCESPAHKLLCIASIGDHSFHLSQASNFILSWQQYLFC